MLFFIIIPIILAIFLIYQYFTFIRVYYIGQSIHKFRELRSEVIFYLSANVKTQLSIEEAIQCQNFLMGLNATIKFFDLLLPEFTKFSSVKSIPSKMLFTSEKLTSNPHSGSIPSQYIVKLKDCYLTLFKAIPFSRFRIYLYFLRLLATLKIKLGFRNSQQQLATIEKLAKIEKDILSTQTVPCNP